MLGKRVLVIEDDKDSLHAISELLRRADYEVVPADTGREGLRLLHGTTPPDFVVLDFWLPDMTGHTFLTMRSRWPRALQVPVVLVTGDDGWLDEHTDLRQLGVAGLLRKPIDPEELLQSLVRAHSTPPEARPTQAPSDGDTAVVGGAARQVKRLSDLLARVSEVLAQGTDIAAQLRDVARAIVPAYAAACVIERVDSAAALREVMCTQHESAALDSDLRAWACQPEWFEQVITEVVDSGKPRVLDLQEEADVLAIGGSRTDVASARALGFESVVIAPLIARRRVFGIVTCASRATRRYGRNHVEAFADLGHRVALALDNTELSSAAQQTRRDHDELLAALSGEVQAPLAALADAAARGLHEAGATSERSTLVACLRDLRRVQARLRQLLDFAQLRAGHLQLGRQSLELAPLVRRVVEQTQKLDGHSKLALRIDAGVAGLQVHADPERLNQTLEVLLHVALAKSDARPLEVLLSRVEGDLLVTLTGSGSRLSAEELAALSALTVDDSGDAASPMLGLQLARALIAMQGGRLWADQSASPDGDTALHCSLPLSAAEPQVSTELPSPETVILLVDSDLAFRRELQEILSERGYNVVTADNGLQAWQYLLAHSPPALVLLDLVLPAMDGWELHAAIRGHATLQVVPTIVVSGLDRYRIEASLPDAHGYIEKPIRSAQLFELVQRHVVTPVRPRVMSVRPSSCL
jgi:CheY-like chemotaxis protein